MQCFGCSSPKVRLPAVLGRAVARAQVQYAIADGNMCKRTDESGAPFDFESSTAAATAARCTRCEPSSGSTRCSTHIQCGAIRYPAPEYAFCPLPCVEITYDRVNVEVSTWPSPLVPGLARALAQSTMKPEKETAGNFEATVYFAGTPSVA